MKLPKIGIVIPCFNGWEFTKKCIISIKNCNYSNYEIIIVNDGSTDSTLNSLRVDFPEIVVYNGDGYLWWSKSMNIGIEIAFNGGAEYILVLNNDVEIGLNTFDALIGVALENDNAIVGSLVMDLKSPKNIWSSGGKMVWPWPGEVQLNDLKGFKNNHRYVDWNPGMGTLIPRHIFKKLVGFDSKNFPQYMGDVDFCLRAIKLGFKIIVTSSSVIYNNIENTGGVIEGNKRFCYRDIYEIFQSYRSPDLLKARLRFIFRHSPLHFLFPALFIRYSKLFFYIIKKIK
jgi:GT2 family glycosyltransferase